MLLCEMVRRRRRVLFAVVPCLLIAGCSAGREGTEYAIRANEICNTVVERLPRRSAVRPGAAIETRFTGVIAARRKAIGRLRELTPPARDQELVNAMVDQLEKSQRLLEVSQRRGKGESRVGLIIAAAIEGKKASRAARELRLPACARL